MYAYSVPRELWGALGVGSNLNKIENQGESDVIAFGGEPPLGLSFNLNYAIASLNGGASGPNPSDPRNPNYKRTFGKDFVFSVKLIFGLSQESKTKSLKDYVQFVIEGKGLEDFSQSFVGTGKIGVWKVGDPDDIMTVLGYLTTSNQLDAQSNFFAVYYSDPRKLSDALLPFLANPAKNFYLYREVGKSEMENYQPGYYRYRDIETGKTDTNLWIYVGNNTMRRTEVRWKLYIGG